MKDRRPKGIRTRRPATIHRRDMTVQLGIRTTTLARAVLDMAPKLPEQRLRRVVNDALHSKFMTNSQLADVLARTPTTRAHVDSSPSSWKRREASLIVEIDSWEFHNDRISFEDNRDRDADNLADGLPTIRITDTRMKRDPAKEAERLRTILRELEKRPH